MRGDAPTEPRVGTLRVIRRWPLLPRTAGGEWRCWERVAILQEYRRIPCNPYGVKFPDDNWRNCRYSVLGWADVRFDDPTRSDDEIVADERERRRVEKEAAAARIDRVRAGARAAGGLHKYVEQQRKRGEPL